MDTSRLSVTTSIGTSHFTDQRTFVILDNIVTRRNATGQNTDARQTAMLTSSIGLLPVFSGNR
jgi:hypothetical protein